MLDGSNSNGDRAERKWRWWQSFSKDRTFSLVLLQLSPRNRMGPELIESGLGGVNKILYAEVACH